MTYLIERTSNWHDEDPEVEGAYLIKVHNLYKNRSKECPDHIVKACTNIRKEGNVWVGEHKEPDEYYAVDINSLDELNAFVTKIGDPIIISESDNAEGFMHIEIYDTYRE